MEKYLLFGAVAALIVGVIVFNIIRNSKIRKNGVEADAVVSRIEEQESTDADGSLDVTYTYYVSYRTQDGQDIEAKLNHAPGRTRVGEQVRIKYLPEKPKFAILIK